MGSLQEALLKSGLAREDRGADKKSGKKRRKNDVRKGGNPGSHRPRNSRDRGGEKATGKRKSDLERAWEARRSAERAEKERAKQARVADQEARRRRNLELDRIVDGRVLNVDNAELPRYFEHLGRVRRVMCTPEQRAMINDGRLGIVSLRGRYLIVEPDVLEAYRAVAADLVPDLGGEEPEDPGGEWPPVPDEMTW